MMWMSSLAVALVMTASLSAAAKPEDDETLMSISLAGNEPEVPVSLHSDMTHYEKRDHNSIQPRDDMEELEVPIGRKKVKIKLKKKHKKFLTEMLMAGLLIKSALLPLAVGALKLLTAKAFMMTMMALGLALALTFRSAKEKHVTTEVINLVPNKHGKHRSLSEDHASILSGIQTTSSKLER